MGVRSLIKSSICSVSQCKVQFILLLIVGFKVQIRCVFNLYFIHCQRDLKEGDVELYISREG